MNNHARLLAPGDCYFFTVRLRDASCDLLVRQIDLLRDTIRLTQQNHPFEIKAAVILPNRLHMIWTLPPGDSDYRMRWQLIKTTFARHAVDASGRRSGAGLWQRRFWEQPVRSPEDLDFYTNAIAAAPVEEGLVKQSKLWPHSSLWPGRKPAPSAELSYAV